GMQALTGLERICRVTEQYQRLVEVIDLQIDAASENADRVEALLWLGELYERNFLRLAGAGPQKEGALELDGACEVALEGLERCWHALRDWDKLAGSLERRAAGVSHPREAIKTLVCLAEVRESKQESVDAALAAWRRVYELDTCHAET